ncbi:hypothetical protein [Azospirillum sp.]|uniref:hypothetical protein n=1 Tax=Azospirillum sp. TaxID=34012 RepID=UPI003D70F9E4
MPRVIGEPSAKLVRRVAADFAKFVAGRPDLAMPAPLETLYRLEGWRATDRTTAERLRREGRL